MQDGLDSVGRLVERTRFLLTGEAPSGAEELIDDAEVQATAPSTSETVQKPSGE